MDKRQRRELIDQLEILRDRNDVLQELAESNGHIIDSLILQLRSQQALDQILGDEADDIDDHEENWQRA